MSALTIPELQQHLTDRDVQILQDLEQFRLLTTRHIQRLNFPVAPYGSHASLKGATRGTSRVLARLEQLDAVARLDRRIGGIKHGSALAIWRLGAAGERLLRRRQPDQRRRRFTEPSYTFLKHTLAIADIGVDLREHAHAGNVELLELETEPTCWRTFNDGLAVITLKPDLLVVTADDSTETHSFVEVDLGSEHTPAVLKKCRTYQRYAHTGTEQAARGLFPAVVWIVPTQTRRDGLQSAISADGQLEPDLFWVTTGKDALAHLAPYGTVTT